MDTEVQELGPDHQSAQNHGPQRRMICNKGYIKVDGVSSVFCFIWGWEEPTWGLPFQFHGVFYVMISMKGP